ncbi:MAG TPA: protein kinase, partial [Labilithrix sp.]
MPEGDLPETIGGRYRTIRLIGRGAMGAVYEVEHVHTGERLALKLLLQSHRIDPVGVERFKREARASSRIKSPNVVRVTDADIAPEQGGAPFLVMELLEGADLEEVARTTKPAPAEVVGWLRQIARALDKAHGIGIIHRDLKPANVFLADGVDGGPPVVKILDFGLAKVVSDDRAQTRSGQILGTPMYMSPEQADPDGPPESPRSDLFSLGLIAFRLLVGDDYWGAGNVRQILTRILVEPMPPASQRGSSFGDAFDAWFAKACDREPSSRFASAHEMVEALAAALDVPVISRPASSDSSGARRPSRDPTLFEVAPTLNASVTSAPRITRASSSPLRVVIGVVAAALVGGLAWTALRHDPQTTAAPDAGPTSASPKAITDFPLPSSSVAEANSAYADALRAERNGANDDAVRLYERAVRLDPKLGAGHLRIVLLTMATGQPKARAHFHDAEASAATLDARDAAILDALRPLFLNEPPDVDGWAARFDSLARTRPDDAEIQVARAEVSNALGAFRDAAAAFGRALEADPLFGYASDRKYEMELYAGDVDAARATSAACRARASAVGRCPPGPEVFHSETCAEYAASMRARLSASPGSRERFGLAYALAATGAPRAAVDEALG